MNHVETPDEYLEHHGIIGQKWGVRRYQNKDGSLTSLGKKRMESADARTARASAKFKLDSAHNAEKSIKYDLRGKASKADRYDRLSKQQKSIADKLDTNLSDLQRERGMASEAKSRARKHGLQAAALTASAVVLGLGSMSAFTGAAAGVFASQVLASSPEIAMTIGSADYLSLLSLGSQVSSVAAASGVAMAGGSVVTGKAASSKSSRKRSERTAMYAAKKNIKDIKRSQREG